jgi:putative phosphoesterase
VLLGVVSDIHCKADALDQAIDAMGDFDELLVAGDLVYEYRFSNEVVETVRRLGAHAIKGNHDMVLLGYHGARARAAAGVRPDLVAHLDSLPERVATSFGPTRLLMVHGSPWPPFGDYLGPRDPAFRQTDELDVDILILGHTHVPMVERFGRTLVVNPGSVAEPRQPGPDRTPTCAVIDTATGEARIIACTARPNGASARHD